MIGYQSHRAIVVTGWQNEVLQEAHAEAVKCFDGTCAFVTEVTKETMNGFASFMVAPDGSKEGWSESDKSDESAARFIEFLNGLRYEDGSSKLDWVYIRFSDNHFKSEVLRASDMEPQDIKSREE